MNTQDFFLLLMDNLGLYFGCLGIAVFIYFLLFRRIWESVFDPIIIGLIGSAFGFSVVLFLYFIDSIHIYYFSNYLLTQAAFWGVFFVFNLNRLSIKSSFKIRCELDFNKAIFVISSFMLIGATLSVYLRTGIPLFMSSRLDVGVDAGGWGIMSRFSSICQFISVYYCYYFLFNRDLCSPLMRKFAWTILTLSVVFMALSGAKSAFFVFIIVFFLYAVSQQKKHKILLQKLKKREPILIITVVVVAVIVVGLRGGSTLEQSVIEVVQRFVGTGDVFWMSYPNDMIDQIDGKSGYKAIFSSMLGAFRLVDVSELPTPIGIDMYRLYYNVEALMGPNARHNVFGLIYFGPVGSIVFSAVLGSLLGLMRSFFVNANFVSLFPTILTCYLYYILCSVEGDINYVVGEITSLIITLVFLLFFSVLLFVMMESKKKISNGKC